MENRRSSPDNKRFSPSALIPLVILLGAAACAPQPTPDQSDMATYVAGQKTAAAMLTADANAFKTKYPLQTPTPEPPHVWRVTQLSCATVAENGSAYQALLEADNGTQPPKYDPDGYETYVQIDHRDPATQANIRFLLTMAQLLKQGAVVAAGDRVCFSSDTDRLRQVPTPTPGPYVTPTSQSLRQNNMQSRSFAVAVNPTPVQRRRG